MRFTGIEFLQIQLHETTGLKDFSDDRPSLIVVGYNSKIVGGFVKMFLFGWGVDLFELVILAIHFIYFHYLNIMVRLPSV